MAKSVFELVGRILIDNADALEKISDTTDQAKGLSDALKGAGDKADDTSKKMGSSSKFNTAAVWMGTMLYDLSKKAGELVLNLGKIGFGFNMSIESFEYQFSALLGDADKAKQLVADLQELAKISPLGLEGLAGNALSLLQNGTELAEIVPTLEMLGNLALGDPQNMDSTVRAFTQIISKGGLMAQEMYQLGDAMIPIVEIMTKYGGERYADGSWYEQKMTDPTFKIPAEDMIKAFQAATAEGGKWHDFMNIYMDSFAGQWDRLGEEGKEALGAFFEPFFEVAKSEVLPKLAESLDGFRTWATENKDTIATIAESVGNFATISFDAVLGALQYIAKEGESVSIIIGGMATAFAIGAIAAHPYAAAIMAVAAGLAWLSSEEAKQNRTYNHFFDGHSQEAMEALQDWVEAKRAWEEADNTYQMYVTDEEYDALVEAAEAAARRVNELDGDLIGLYNEWRSGQENSLEYLDVPLQVSEESESEMQEQLNGMTLEGVVKLIADPSGLQAAVDATGLNAYVRRPWSDSTVDGSHANGLDYVPHDGYFARLHRGETVLTRQQADVWRGGNSGRIESLLNQIVANTNGGQMVVLDSGVLVGQIASQMDGKLGTIGKHKGRGN